MKGEEEVPQNENDQTGTWSPEWFAPTVWWRRLKLGWRFEGELSRREHASLAFDQSSPPSRRWGHDVFEHKWCYAVVRCSRRPVVVDGKVFLVISVLVRDLPITKAPQKR